ncbi:MAG TPA: endopeptidase La [Bryobacteraceae bacterium]|nr:endopeptidase La [Bryobacteraceae bacterium]
MADVENVQTLPLLPLKNSVLFPYLFMPLAVGRSASLAAAEAAMATEGKEIIVVAQRDPNKDVPATAEDLYTIGTKAVIKKMARPNESQMDLIVLGVERVVILKFEQTEPHPQVRVNALPLPQDHSQEVEALHRAVAELAGKVVTLAQPNAPAELAQMLTQTEDPLRLVYLLGSMMNLELAKEQALLEAQTRAEALRLMHAYLTSEFQVLQLRDKIATEAQSEMSKQQREYLLRQQLHAIQQELGERDPQQAEIELLRERLEKLKLPEEVSKEAMRELSRLERLPPGAPDYQVIRTYLDFVVELPWNTFTEDNLDIARAREILDQDHYDLKDVKERILEQLGVLKLNPEAKAPILCFYGPPGVGKTSLGQSIARALGRKFERMSLGGLHDEAELRGHRRTYIGAMPGRVVQAIRRAGSRNPVLMLDEVDKLGRDFRGDPASALLEILDPEQNKSFRDNYLDLPFDLSKVFFITTANTLDTIPRPLLDRMEMLRLPGYPEEEKAEIAKRYLIPRQLRQAGLKPEEVTFGDGTLHTLIARYTREAGLRQLERTIGRVARKIALRHAEGDVTAITVRPEDVAPLLGAEIFPEDERRKEQPPGVATGLAWTETGGEVLYIEATLLPGGKGLTITGQIGEVMQESARAAQSYIWSHAEDLGVDPAVFRDAGVHLHVPAGAVPKDGPSAGVTMATALASLYTQTPVRTDTAMTGEITLTGLVLPIGGLKEKVLAARRAGIHRIIAPKGNEKDLQDFSGAVRKETEFIFVERIEQVLEAAFPRAAEEVESLKAG